MKETAIIISLALFQIGCSSPDPPKKHADTAKNEIFNPNGDSQLALLMRQMFEESERVKAQIEIGQTPSGLKRFEEIHTALPTDADASGPVFEAFSNAYIESIKALESSDSSTVFRFNRMVDQCMNCHTEFCPGPKRKIKKLYISEG